MERDGRAHRLRRSGPYRFMEDDGPLARDHGNRAGQSALRNPPGHKTVQPA